MTGIVSLINKNTFYIPR